ncbi:hypothetical protein SF23_18720, partial [Streptomyces sp. MBRL 10]
MSSIVPTNDNARSKRRGYRLATVVAAAAVIAGGVALPASAATATTGSVSHVELVNKHKHKFCKKHPNHPSARSTAT